VELFKLHERRHEKLSLPLVVAENLGAPSLIRRFPATPFAALIAHRSTVSAPVRLLPGATDDTLDPSSVHPTPGFAKSPSSLVQHRRDR
jgi:hypothetical protein